MRIDYKRQVKSCAMSKSPNQIGLNLTKTEDKIKIQAINPRTKGITSYLYVEIPVENINDVIKALIQLRDNV